MDFTTILKTVAPWLATAIGGPLAPLAINFLADRLGVPDKTVDAVKAAVLGMTPEQQLALKDHDQEFALKMQGLGYSHIEAMAALVSADKKNELDAQTTTTVAVNTSIQTEAKADHWATWLWRPFIGLAVGFTVAVLAGTVCAAYVGVIFGNVKPEMLSYIPGMLGAMSAVIGVTMPVLGIASYFRGKMQADPNIATDNRG
jgi:hypothetical protein